MRMWPWALCAAAVFGPAVRAQAQPKPPVDQLPPPTGGDTFTAPIFNLPGVPKPSPAPPPGGTLYDAATAGGPLPSPANDAVSRLALAACGCGPEFTTWLTGEWVIGTTRGPTLVPVITTGPAAAGALAGAVGQPMTVPLFGGHPVLNDWRSGLRVEAGVWLDPDHQTGLTARFYSLFSATEVFSARPNGAVVLNLPQFTGLGTGAVQTPLFVAFPGATAGGVRASARTSFAGGDLDVRELLGRGDNYRVELLAGYRQMHLGDELNASFSTSAPAANSFAAVRELGGDNVNTRNNFYGPQLGLCAATQWNRLSLEANVASAMGVTVSELNFGRARSVGPVPAGTAAGTLAALGVPFATATTLAPAVQAAAANPITLAQANMHNTLTYLGVVGECGLRASWRATDRLRLTAGYSFIYWNNVRRAEEMFVTSTVLRPRAVDFTTQLVSVGLDFRY